MAVFVSIVIYIAVFLMIYCISVKRNGGNWQL